MNKGNTYKKLFNINYNNKIFTIFIVENGRRTFLELVSNNIYKCPNIKDYVYLNKVFNNRNSFILYDVGDRLPIHIPEKVRFKEQIIASIIVFPALLSSVFGLNSIFYRTFDDSKVLDSYLGTSFVSIDELIDVINNNPNLDDIYKENAIRLAKYIQDKHPNTDNRIFCDNMKNITIKELKDNRKNKYIAGNYDFISNVIGIKNKNEVEEKSADPNSFENEVIIHELAHAYHCWSNNNKFVLSYRYSNIGHSLDEAMTEKIIAGLFKNSTRTYHREIKILDYLLTFVDYSYYDYERGGIDKLNNLLKENYSEVDIDYIFNFTDTMCTASLKQGEYIKIEESSEFLDNLFDLCIHNIDYSDDMYESLINFFKVIDYNKYPELVTKYTNEYNNILMENGISDDLINDSEMLSYVEKKSSSETFDDYLDTLYFKNIDLNDIYKPFNDYYITKANCDDFIKLLDKYNNYLISNGIPFEKIITLDEFIDKYQKYQNISVTGFIITSDENIYLKVDIPNKDQIYNTLTRIPVLDKDGKVTLIDNNSIVKNVGINKIQNVFIYYLFKSNKDDFSWYNNAFFNKEYDITEFSYRKVNITLNGKTITKDYYDNLMVIIGISEDGTYTFKLRDRENNILFYNEKPIMKVPFDLREYLNLTKFEDTIELTNYFNGDYLKRFAKVRTKLGIYDDEYFYYDELNDKVVFKPNEEIILDNSIDKIIDINTIYMDSFYNEKLGSTNNFICIGKNKYILSINIEVDKPIFFFDVLNYYAMYDVDSVTAYKFTTEEIINLFNNYLRDNLNFIDKDNYKSR